MLLYTRIAAPKQPKRRSRGGCAYCKEKKKKCDEKRPKCSRCLEHDTECAYEAVKPRQRRRRDSDAPPGSPSSARLSFAAARRFSSSQPDFFVGDHAGLFTSLLGYSASAAAAAAAADDDPIILSPSSDAAFDGFPLLPPFCPRDFWEDYHPAAAPAAAAVVVEEEEEAPTAGAGEKAKSTAVPSTAVVPRASASSASASASAPAASRSRLPDLAMIAPCPARSPLRAFCAPAFAEFSDRQSRRALVAHFCNVLSHLIVFREETGNPFQQLVLPLTAARAESPVTYAILALACAHLEYRGVENAEKSLFFHNMAIRGVAGLIRGEGKAGRNEVLAAIMLLVYYECLVQKGQSNIVVGHLKGALTIMGTVPDPADSTSVFLERAFCFYDVISALSNGTSPLSPAPAPGYLMPLSPLGAPSASPLSNVDTLLGMATTLWPIIHRLAGLRALKTDLESAIAARAPPAQIAVLRTEFRSTTQAIESALLAWQPRPNNPATGGVADEEAQDGTAQQQQQDNNNNNPLSSIHHNALAYRHASLVHLHRTVHLHARAHPAVQLHAHLALQNCVATAAHGGPLAALLWPLFVAACEAVTEEDRGMARRAFEAVEERQGMRNIGRAWEVVGEVWRRAGGEEGEGEGGEGVERVEQQEELWRRVCGEMGVSIVFG